MGAYGEIVDIVRDYIDYCKCPVAFWVPYNKYKDLLKTAFVLGGQPAVQELGKTLVLQSE